MKRFVCATSLVLALVVSSAAEALSLSPLDAFATTAYNSTIDTPGEWFTYLGITPEPALWYKSEVSGTTGLGVDQGTYAASYQTTFSNTAEDPSAALIQYLGGGSIGCGACYLLVKDGNSTPAQYLFSLSTWNGTDNIVLSGFWPQQGAISNVAIYTGDTTKVPEPAALSLLLMGLVGLGGVRARLRNRSKCSDC